MDIKSFEELKDLLCKEIEEIANKGELSAGDLDALHKLTATIKNMDKIMMFDDADYSGDGEWEAHGSYANDRSYENRNYIDSDSYANRGKHYVRAHYSRDPYYMNDNYSMRKGNNRTRRYSRADGREQMMMQLENMMDNATNNKEREAIQRCMKQLENI